jgi:hypothetical protein
VAEEAVWTIYAHAYMHSGPRACTDLRTSEGSKNLISNEHGDGIEQPSK